MAGLLDLLLPNLSVDVIAVYDDTFTQVFQEARPIKAAVTETTKVMEHPVEDGTVITDHKIIQPTEIELSTIIEGPDYQSVYQRIKQLYIAGTLLTVQTRSGSYNNMIIYEMPHDEDAAIYDALPIGLKLREVQFVSATFGTLPPRKVKNKTQASTTKRGEQQPNAKTDQSILAAIGRAVKP